MKLLIPLILIFVALSCQEKNISDQTESTSLISELLTDRVNPLISVDDEIVLRFKDGVILEEEKSTIEFDIAPDIDFNSTWIDDHTIKISPTKHLDYNETYTLNVHLEELIKEQKKDHNELVLKFRTRPIEIEMLPVSTNMQVHDNKVEVELSGSILTNQFINESKIEKMLDVEAPGDRFRVDWSHHSGSTIHDFTIHGISQSTKSKKLNIKWNGGRIIENFKGNQNVLIEGSANFKIKEVVLFDDPNRYILVQFSQPLDTRQDLKGLISINDDLKQTKTLIEGNNLKIYPGDNIDGIINLEISKLISSFSNSQLSENHKVHLNVEPIKPQIKLTENGVIVLPDRGFTFPFEAVNLDSIDLEIFKIYDQNVLQFMQDNDLTGDYNLQNVGTIVHSQKVKLRGGAQGRNSWKSYALDLQEYIENDINAIYQIRVGFRPSYVNYKCSQAVAGYKAFKPGESILRYHYYGYQGRNNPCSASFYTPDKFIKRNVLISNVAGVIKKDLNNGHYVAITSLSTGEPIYKATVSFFDAQKIELASVITDEHGMAYSELDKSASFAIVEHFEGTTYLNLRDAQSLSLTDFNVGGKLTKSGIDAFLYTDRGVYRPGDSIFMHVMLDEGSRSLPSDHPIVLSVKDPQGQLRYSQTTSDHLDQIYTFSIPTDPQDPTGAWRALVEIGSVQFSKRINIETIKPNRLRLSLDMDERISYSNIGSRKINLSSSWLHGAPASGLRAKIDAQWSSMNPFFSNYNDYTFHDPARKIRTSQITLFDGRLDNSGNSAFNINLNKDLEYPAMLKADITNRVFEKGGDYSETYGTIQVSPYGAYVGVSMPKNQWGSRQIKIGEEAHAEVVVVGENGKPLGNRQLSIGVYDIKWEWWYYRSSSSNIYELNSDNHSKAVLKEKVVTGANGYAKIPIKSDDLEYGRKLIRICDEESGHCTGQYFYASGWGNQMESQERNSLSKLNFKTNKTNYTTGEQVELMIPSQEGSNILISLETDKEVLSQNWIKGSEEGTTYKFQVDKNMAPNIYAHVTLIQPYDQLNNDLPLRMYGVLPIQIEDPESFVTPKIETPVEIKPKETFLINISEEQGKSMTYTINIVDEGLLDLTNFSTPNPHKYFFAKKSLGVKTWDMYDQVLYGLNGTPDKIISVGGDGEVGEGKGQKKAIRFKPVVFSAGPFKLEKGATKSHSFEMPNYIGSVRVMIVARKDEAFGHADIAIPVRTPLMILPTVPRVISQGEKIKIPVSVFSMQEDVKDVSISLEMSSHLKAAQSRNELTFDKPGEKITSFEVNAGDKVGVAKIDVQASTNRYKASQQIEVDIRNPNPVTTQVKNFILQSGEKISHQFQTFGVENTNKGILELSLFPAIRMADRLDYLVRYPYGCLEQTTSSAFVQLYLRELTDYIPEEEINKNVKAGIKRILKMQSNDGGFKYWPSTRSVVSEWASSYAAHFLLEAKNKGYYISSNVLRNWSRDQQKRAARFRISDYKTNYLEQQAYLIQAYRLYTLALHGTPELSAMNNLRSHTDLPSTGKFLLAAAYSICNKSNIALDLIRNASSDIPQYRDRGITYGSEVRDMALIAQSMSYLNRKNESYQIIKKIADLLNSNKWYSTQSIAFGLMAVGKLPSDFHKGQIEADVALGSSDPQTINYEKSFFTFKFDPDQVETKNLDIENDSDNVLFASFQLSGQKSTSSLLSDEAVNENVGIKVNYKHLDGTPIDMTNITQGTDFLAEIEIRNLNTSSVKLDEMALSHIIPSGWEIRSGRLNKIQNSSDDSYEFRDVRDDRVNTFFDLTDKKNFTLMLNAAYQGEFFLPPITVEAMYDKSIFARTKGQKVIVKGK